MTPAKDLVTEILQLEADLDRARADLGAAHAEILELTNHLADADTQLARYREAVAEFVSADPDVWTDLWDRADAVTTTRWTSDGPPQAITGRPVPAVEEPQ